MSLTQSRRRSTNHLRMTKNAIATLFSQHLHCIYRESGRGARLLGTLSKICPHCLMRIEAFPTKERRNDSVTILSLIFPLKICKKPNESSRRDDWRKSLVRLVVVRLTISFTDFGRAWPCHTLLTITNTTDINRKKRRAIWLSSCHWTGGENLSEWNKHNKMQFHYCDCILNIIIQGGTCPTTV